MDCPEDTGFTSAGFMRQFGRNAAKARVPVNGTFAITYGCNMRCRMCYSGRPFNAEKAAEPELSTSRITGILDEITEAGCLSLLLTGGEPLLRKDFAEIYTHAKRKGMLVTVFTNGTLLTDATAALFEDLPPRAVEITVYGATQETYESITGAAGSFQKCISGIELLLKRNVNVRLKTVLTTLNRHEFGEIEQLAKQYGVRFRFDACIFPSLHGDASCLDLRVPVDEAVAAEFSDHERAMEWCEFFRKNEGAGANMARLYGCGAGVTAFYIDPAGWLHPCLMARRIRRKTSGGDFAECWKDIVREMNGLMSSEQSRCYSCGMKSLCGYCPGFFDLETGSEIGQSMYICEMGHRRMDAIRSHMAGSQKGS